MSPQDSTAKQAPQPGMADDYRWIRQLPLFEGIPNDFLSEAMKSGSVKREVIDRDNFVAEPAQASAGDTRLFLIIEGQVAVGVFEPGEMQSRVDRQRRVEQMDEEQRKEQSLLPLPPLARVAKKNLSVFMSGDLFNSGVLKRTGEEIAMYAISPVELVSLEPQSVESLVRQYPFFEQRVRRAIEVCRERLTNIVGVKQEILDFFVRQGISVAGEMVRVRQLDSCIDCKLCEEACEERYGAKRLTLGGYQLGMLDFVFTCRTCTDQRCITPCEYDSISFNEAIGEVVINEASCVGCTLCAQACPYSAIEMVDVDDSSNPTFREDFKLRLDNAGRLAFGPGKPRVARARRIANKCDHCMGYAEQACVSACPTGSLIEVSASELFFERSPAAKQLAAAGFDQDVVPSAAATLPLNPFTKGIGVRDAGLAKVRRARALPVLFWGVGLLSFLLVFVEIMLRLYRPANSLQYMLLTNEGLEPLIARNKVSYFAGSELALWCGYIGGVLMLIALLYSSMRRLKFFRKISSNTMWFDFHMMAGTVGPMYIVLHSALRLDNWVSLAFWSMVMVVISGVIGRYLYTKVPDLLNGRELEELDHRRAFAAEKSQYPQAVSIIESVLARYASRVDERAKAPGMIGAFLWVLGQDLARPFTWFLRRRQISRGDAPWRVRRALLRRTGRMLLIERRRVMAPRAQLLLHSWKKVHVPFSFIMAAISVVHIWFALQ